MNHVFTIKDDGQPLISQSYLQKTISRGLSFEYIRMMVSHKLSDLSILLTGTSFSNLKSSDTFCRVYSILCDNIALIINVNEKMLEFDGIFGIHDWIKIITKSYLNYFLSDSKEETYMITIQKGSYFVNSKIEVPEFVRTGKFLEANNISSLLIIAIWQVIRDELEKE